jgi:hypothetical protein
MPDSYGIIYFMKTSRVMDSVKRDLQEAQKKMSPKERLSAFVEHSRLLTAMFEAGAAYRRRKTAKR